METAERETESERESKKKKENLYNILFLHTLTVKVKLIYLRSGHGN